MQVINSLKSRVVRLPVHLASAASAADLVAGTLLMKGTSGATDLGTAIVTAAASASGYVGILAERHTYSLRGSALVAGAQHSAVIPAATGAAWFAPVGGNPDIFPSPQIELVEGLTLCRIPYLATGVQVTNSSGTSVTITSAEENMDTSFLYASAGEALGQLRFVVSDTTNTWVTSNAFTTMTSAGYVVKMCPLLHGLFVLTVGNTTTPTKIDTTAAAGAARLIQLERHIVRNGADEIMDPYTHGNLSGLNSLSQLEFYGVFGLCSTVFSPLS